MNVWLLFSGILLLALVPCAIVCLRGDLMLRLVGLEMASTVGVLILLALAEAFERDFLFDMAMAQALLSFGGALVFTRFYERWL